MFSKRRKLLIALLVLLCALTVAFIWGNSLRSKDESQHQSRALLEAMEPVIEYITGEDIDVEDDTWLRKTAHFLEFGLLGTELALLAAALRRYSLQDLCTCLFIGLLTAVLDEYIQIYSGRGSQVSDVLLDFSGVLIAVAVVSVICQRRKKRGMQPEGN